MRKSQETLANDFKLLAQKEIPSSFVTISQVVGTKTKKKKRFLPAFM
jgi:hypothetical protein